MLLTFAADKLFEGGGGDMSSRISSPSAKPLPKLGTGGPERLHDGDEELFGTSEAAFGERRTGWFVEGLDGTKVLLLFCCTLRDEESCNNQITTIYNHLSTKSHCNYYVSVVQI